MRHRGLWPDDGRSRLISGKRHTLSRNSQVGFLRSPVIAAYLNPQCELLSLALRYESSGPFTSSEEAGRVHRQMAAAVRRAILLLCLCLAEQFRPVLEAADLVGTARVIDGDTISIADTRIRLWGIDAPERQQRCLGKNGDIYECGRDSAAVLSELTRGRRVECTQRDYDRYGRVVAVCRTESGELNMAMVPRGWAVDYTKYSGGRYRSDEQQARREQLGIWAGRFEMPWEWRHRH